MTRRLRIVHVLRAPVGGLFRHVLDLAGEQAKAGHAVGLIADASTGGQAAEARLNSLEPQLALGITRLAISRQAGLSDIAAWRTIGRHLRAMDAGIVHGHGAKGGAYARLAAPKGAIRVYTPHGGSLHYRRGTPMGTLYLGLESFLARRTDVFLFESAYACQRFAEAVRDPGEKAHIVHNGVSEAEFAPVIAEDDATDIIFVGELRHLKGVDILLKAMGLLHVQGRRITATITGAGPDEALFRQQAAMLGDAVRFTGPLPARKAFAMGRVLVVPSRAESLPYVVLEGGAAGMPVVATNVGGIGEIFGPHHGRLVAPDDAAALARAIVAARDNADEARIIDEVRARFSLGDMARNITSAYGSV